MAPSCMFAKERRGSGKEADGRKRLTLTFLRASSISEGLLLKRPKTGDESANGSTSEAALGRGGGREGERRASGSTETLVHVLTIVSSSCPLRW